MKMLQSQKTEYDGEFWKQTNKTSPPSLLHPLSTAIKWTKQIYKKPNPFHPFSLAKKWTRQIHQKTTSKRQRTILIKDLKSCNRNFTCQELRLVLKNTESVASSTGF